MLTSQQLLLGLPSALRVELQGWGLRGAAKAYDLGGTVECTVTYQGSHPWDFIKFNFCFYVKNFRESKYMWQDQYLTIRFKWEMLWDTGSHSRTEVRPHHPHSLSRFPATVLPQLSTLHHTPFLQPPLLPAFLLTSKFCTGNLFTPWNIRPAPFGSLLEHCFRKIARLTSKSSPNPRELAYTAPALLHEGGSFALVSILIWVMLCYPLK